VSLLLDDVVPNWPERVHQHPDLLFGVALDADHGEAERAAR
jgi:hypothetical protein